MVGEAIKKSRGQHRIAEHFAPAGELEVRGHEHRAFLVALGEELKEQRASRPKTQVSELIDDGQIGLLPAL